MYCVETPYCLYGTCPMFLRSLFMHQSVPPVTPVFLGSIMAGISNHVVFERMTASDSPAMLDNRLLHNCDCVRRFRRVEKLMTDSGMLFSGRIKDIKLRSVSDCTRNASTLTDSSYGTLTHESERTRQTWALDVVPRTPLRPCNGSSRLSKEATGRARRRASTRSRALRAKVVLLHFASMRQFARVPSRRSPSCLLH